MLVEILLIILSLVHFNENVGLSLNGNFIKNLIRGLRVSRFLTR